MTSTFKFKNRWNFKRAFSSLPDSSIVVSPAYIGNLHVVIERNFLKGKLDFLLDEKRHIYKLDDAQVTQTIPDGFSHECFVPIREVECGSLRNKPLYYVTGINDVHFSSCYYWLAMELGLSIHAPKWKKKKYRESYQRSLSYALVDSGCKIVGVLQARGQNNGYTHIQ